MSSSSFFPVVTAVGILIVALWSVPTFSRYAKNLRGQSRSPIAIAVLLVLGFVVAVLAYAVADWNNIVGRAMALLSLLFIVYRMRSLMSE